MMPDMGECVGLENTSNFTYKLVKLIKLQCKSWQQKRKESTMLLLFHATCVHMWGVAQLPANKACKDTALDMKVHIG